MQANMLRRGAWRYFVAHKNSRNALIDSWQDWKQARGDTATERHLFQNDDEVKGLIGDEQMYSRYATMYGIMAIMEILVLQEQRAGRDFDRNPLLFNEGEAQ